VEFEGFVDALIFAITRMAAHQGCNSHSVIATVTSEMTAAPLRTIFQTLVGDHRNFDSKEQAISHALFKSWGGLIEERNSVIHRAWIISAEDGTASGYKNKNTKAGNVNRESNWQVADFERFADDCRIAGMEVRHLASTLNAHRPINLAEAFDFEDGLVGVVRVGDAQIGMPTTRVLARPLKQAAGS